MLNSYITTPSISVSIIRNILGEASPKDQQDQPLPLMRRKVWSVTDLANI